jgi:hypothetical protein
MMSSARLALEGVDFRDQRQGIQDELYSACDVAWMGVLWRPDDVPRHSQFHKFSKANMPHRAAMRWTDTVPSCL